MGSKKPVWFFITPTSNLSLVEIQFDIIVQDSHLSFTSNCHQLSPCRRPLAMGSGPQWHQQILVFVPFASFVAVGTIAPAVPHIGASCSGDPTETTAVVI